MKKLLKSFIFGMLLTMFFITSCTEYLDKDPEAVISEEDAFQNFRNFQGYVEEMYNMIPDLAKGYWVSSFNWGDDEIITIGNGEYLMGHHIDRGNFRAYINKGDCFLDRNTTSTGDRFAKSVWRGSWAGIRKANIGIEAIENGLMIDATQQERDMIAGQLYFFRGWFHFQLIQYWGGLPYIDYVLPSDETPTLPRQSYQECAEKIAVDLRKAADLLPISWEGTGPGSRTPGQNELRANKIWALGFLGKNYLWAGSPLMANGVSGPKTYNAELCKQAAQAFGELLNLVETGQTQYALSTFEDYSSLFYTNRQSWLMPGGTEAIMRGPTYGADSYWRQANSYQPQDMAEGDGILLAPTANYVNYFGMANGMPLNDPNSGFDPSFPWKDRDPRFYNNFIFDGIKVVKGTMSAQEEKWRYASLHTGGDYRNDDRKTSRSGYLNYKFIPIGANRWDTDYGYSSAHHIHLSYLRLADVYLMYAEAAAQGYGSPMAKSTNFSKTAVEAINTVRARAEVGEVAAEYLNSLDAFMGEVRRERAVELSFEGHRFNDLRRWLLLTEYPYNVKTTQHFDRAAPLDPEVDPKENEVVNFREEVIVQRKLDSKHYWFPLKIDDTSMYPEFTQNPGW